MSENHTTISLDDKFTLRKGRIFISGNQALVRLPLLQRELDKAAGLNTAGFLTGYRGSPLGGLDSALWQQQQRLEEHNIVFQPGVNEDLAITACWGTQLLDAIDNSKVDGVFSYWYAKGPGVDRSGDPMKHGNYNGTNKNGGVLVIYGDDHPGKSSTVSHQSEQALAANSIPSFYPANVSEFIEFGLLGWAASRYCGLWVGIKTTNETVEQTATIDIDLDAIQINRPEHEAYPKGSIHIEDAEFVFPPIKHEIRVQRIRIPLLHKFVRANNIDKITIDSNKRKLGIVTAGKAYMDVQQALQLLDVDIDRAQQLGLSLYKVGMIWPLEPQGIKGFARGHDELFFVEEKKAFIEDQAAKILINEPENPKISGKHDPLGEALLPNDVQLEPQLIAQRIAERLTALGMGDSALEQAAAHLASIPEPQLPTAIRAPYFCSGCPHNTSTKVPEGSTAMGGIGCHSIAPLMRADTLPPAHMGGEGAQWAGLHHFTDTEHIFQNIGDGTYFHSGLMCVRNSVASGANITYKILYNDAVAMTGGQPVDGSLSVYEIARQVQAEGVQKTVVVSDQPEQFRRSNLPRDVDVYHRDDILFVQQQLRELKGTSIIIYEQTCAAEKRRRRKIGEFPDPAKRLFINDEVCEGCGDCSVQSTCVSIQPHETVLGRKRIIDQNSCNKDYSCNKGFCPSFVTVLGGQLRKPEAEELPSKLFSDLPKPALAPIDKSYGIMVTGIGGTGIITVSAILGMAAHIDGKACSIFDMTGLSQKNGAVFSHLKISDQIADLGAQRLSLGDAQLLLGFDLVASIADDALRTVSSDTRVVGNSNVTATAMFQFNRDATIDETLLLRKLQDKACDSAVYMVDATSIATALLGNTIGANMFLVGYASQNGLLPLSSESVLAAIELNGTAVAFNIKAFNLGRLYAHNPGSLTPYLPQRSEVGEPQTLKQAKDQGEVFLTGYQSESYAQRFTTLIEKVSAAEDTLNPGSEALAATVARTMRKLMAYKDEYEVARLYSSPTFIEKIQNQFEGDYKLLFNLAPPLISSKDPATGRLRKNEYGAWMLPAFKLLAKLKVLRGTPFDIFGYSAERKQERQLVDDYEQLIDKVCEQLTPLNSSLAVQLAALPQEIKGYGHVKEAKVVEIKNRMATLLDRFISEPQRVRMVDPAA